MTFPPAEIRFSRLKKMALSPAHFRAACEGADEQTPAMRHGALIHAIILGGDYALFEGDRRAGKRWDAFEEENRDRLIVTQPEYARALECAQAVMRHPVAAQFLRGDREARLHWEYLNRACTGRLDVINPRQRFITDLKSGSTSQPEWFTRQAIRLTYHAQFDWYRFGAEANGHQIDHCYSVAFETKKPYAVSVLRLTARALEAGSKLNRLWMERLLACEAANEWPEYVQSVVDLDVPEEVELLFGGDEEAA